MIIKRLADPHIPEVARLHRVYINRGFLSTLGDPFLKLMYSAASKSDKAICLVAISEETGGTVGFISAALDLKGFYREFLARSFLKLGLILLQNLPKPAVVAKIFETLSYPVKGMKDLPDVEILSMAVEHSYRNKRVGSLLFNAIVQEFRRAGVDGFKVIAGSELVPAIGFYEKMGGVLRAEIEVHKNNRSRVYVWSI